MRCSECSAAVAPVVAIDIDGTMADYHGHFIEFAAEYLGRVWGPPGEVAELYDGAIAFSSWIKWAFGISDDEWRDIKLAYRQGAQKRSMPMYRYADAMTAHLRRRGAEIWVCTSRPYLRLDNIDPDTRAWLDRNNIRFDHLLYGDRKYHSLAEQIDGGRVVAVLDDLPEMYDAAQLVFGRSVPILRRTTWNRAVERPNVVSDLNQACEILLRRVDNWNHIYKREATNV